MSGATAMTPEAIDQSEARENLWRLGVVAPWYLRPSQLDVYRLLKREKFPFIEAARRFGKTNSILAFVMEQLRMNPGWICRWCFPFKNQAREVLEEEVPKMQRDCPDELRFKYQTAGSVFIGPGGSKLFIRGVNEDKGESARGPASNIIVADEYGFWSSPGYIIREVLFPQLEGQGGQWLIKASTPPEDLDHKYYTEREDAVRKGRFIQKIIYDNESLSPEELKIIIDESGGVTSTAFRRERLCEPVSDPDKLVVPEYSEELNEVPDDYPRPEFYTPYVGGDSGADDNTVVLFGYHDFIKDELVIEQEIVKSGSTTKKIVRHAKRVEKALWKHLQPHGRVYDAPKQLLLDAFVEYQWPVSLPYKDDKHAAVRELRVKVGERKFKVKKRCKQTRRQLKVGMWKDDRHSDFQRSEGLGHLDAIAAAIYLNRSIDRNHNPWPLNPGVSRYTHFISPGQTPQGKTEQALNSVFGQSRRGLR